MSKKRISVPQPDSQERGSMQDIMQLLRSGRTGLEQGAYNQNILAPYLSDLAGLDVQYDDRSGQLQELNASRDKAMSTSTALKQANNPKARKALLAELASSGKFGDALNKKGKLKGKKLKKYLKGQVQGAEREIGDISNAPLRIKSITEKAGAKAQREREAAILQQEQDMLQKSLSMNNEDVLNADPALKRQLAEEQAKLDQAQVQQFGDLAGAQGGTVGAVQNAAMAQRRGEAISNARRENIGLYAGLQTNQAAQNTQQNAARQGMASLPSAQQQQSGLNFGQLASGYGTLLNQKAGIRGQQFQANAFNQTQPGLGEKILSGIGSLLQPFKQQG